MNGSRTTRRLGFTLTEMLVALAVGLLLLAAVYVAMDMQFRFAQTGRETVQHSTLARSLLARMQSDMTPSLGPPPPQPSPSQGAQNSQNSQDSQNQQGTQGQGGMTDNSAQQPSAQPAMATTTTQSAFNLAVQGDSERLTLFLTRLPTSPRATGGAAGGEAVVSDIRRITYWLAGAGGEPLGLARQEVLLITSDDAQAAADGFGDESSFVIAGEVKSVSFSYFDGTNWLDSWDGSSAPTSGSTVSPDGMTPTNNLPAGPPLAIAVVIGLPRATNPGELQMYRHVVAIPTANGIR